MQSEYWRADDVKGVSRKNLVVIDIFLLLLRLKQ